MEFWMSTSSAVLAGVLTFLLTTVPYGFVKRAKWSRAPIGGSDRSITTNGNGPVFSVTGDVGRDLTATLNDNRHIKKKRVKTVQSTTINNAASGTSSGDDEAMKAIGLIIAAIIVAVVSAMLFVTWSRLLLAVSMIFLGVVLGLVVNLVWPSVRTHGWTAAIRTLVAQAGISTVVLIATWVGVFSTARGVLQIDAMQATLTAAAATLTTPNPIQRALDLGMIFQDAYGPQGIGFVVQLLLATIAASLLLFWVTFELLSFRRYQHALDGRVKRKKERKRALAHGQKTWKTYVPEWIGIVLLSTIALACANGAAYDALVWAQNQQSAVVNPTVPHGAP